MTEDDDSEEADDGSDGDSIERTFNRWERNVLCNDVRQLITDWTWESIRAAAWAELAALDEVKTLEGSSKDDGGATEEGEDAEARLRSVYEAARMEK